ncbi:DUF4277 domain-containing protein [Methanofollis tationis]|uniref:DUF4277 domain-containing protein n=1 Tax=Methanofollis tationis TaxID=81417 RepID=A0A7K4HPD6_9EURY|nr:DUF4277 domain-containing protein [Methanofollis tationis]
MKTKVASVGLPSHLSQEIPYFPELSNRNILVISGKTSDVPSSPDFIEGSNISIGHLGLVAGAFDTLGIAPVIDRAIPKTRQHHLTHGV